MYKDSVDLKKNAFSLCFIVVFGIYLGKVFFSKKFRKSSLPDDRQYIIKSDRISIH